MPQTPNHGYNVPNEGATDWHLPLNDNFEQYDTDIEIRDTDANKGNYDPKQGAKFLATDTETVYIGDGSSWNRLASTGTSPTVSQLNPNSDFLGVGRGSTITNAEYFGVQAPVGSASFGGMYVNTKGDGWPFYGYASGGIGRAWHFYDSTDDTWKLNNGGRNLAVDSSGRVGIGTESPTVPIDIRGRNNWDLDSGDGDLRIGNDDFRLAIGVALGGGGAGNAAVRAKGGQSLHLGAGERRLLSLEADEDKVFDSDPVDPVNFVGIGTSNRIGDEVIRARGIGSNGAKMVLDVTEPVGQNSVAYSFAVDGSVEAWTSYDYIDEEWIAGNPHGSIWIDSNGDFNAFHSKNFVQHVDTDDGEKEVVYTSTEAPTPRTEASGVAELDDGRAEIDLPEHFAWVTDADEPLVVQTTPYGGSSGLKIVERSTDRLVIEDLDGEGDYEFAYTIKGTREGYADKEVVREPSSEAAESPTATPADD